jgi:hypothetical protein
MPKPTVISSNLEEPFDFGNSRKAIGGEYTLTLEDQSRIRIKLYPDQKDVPYTKFKFYIDYIWVNIFGLEQVGADVPGSGEIVLDQFLPAGTPVLGALKLISVSYETYI